MKERVGVIGCGVIGSSLIQSLKAHATVWGAVRTREQLPERLRRLGVPLVARAEESAQRLAMTDVVLLAVKPQQVQTVKPLFVSSKLPKHSAVISFVTGVSVADLQRLCGTTNVARVVTSTALTTGRGVSTVSFAPELSAKIRKRVMSLLAHLGEIIEVEESLVPVMTSVIGSGVAFWSLFVESFVDAAVKLGVPRGTAQTVVCHTMAGTAAILSRDGSPRALRDDVATPGGCTIVGLLKLEDGRIRSAIASAVEECARKAADLGKER